MALFVLPATERHIFLNHVRKRLGVYGNAVLGFEFHLIAKPFSRLDGDRLVASLQRAVFVLVGAYMQANVKGAVTPVNDTFSVKYADFIFHAVAQVLLRFRALNSILRRFAQGK